VACEIIHSSEAVFVVWGQPTREDIIRVSREVAQTAARSGHPIVYLTRVPVDAPAPDAELRKFINGQMPTLIESCSSYHVIMEGSGFVAAVKRGVLTSMLRPIWKKKLFFVHARAEGVTRTLFGAERSAAEELLDRARRLGLLTCTAPASALPRSAAG
jgi:hypothetical protein